MFDFWTYIPPFLGPPGFGGGQPQGPPPQGPPQQRPTQPPPQKVEVLKPEPEEVKEIISSVNINYV